MYLTQPLTPVAPVITPAELAAFLVADVADPLLPMLCATATGLAIEFLRCELLSRQREVIYENWPTIGTNLPRGLSENQAAFDDVVELPYAKLLTVQTVELFGEATTNYRALSRHRSALQLSEIGGHSDTEPAIKCVYTAGYGDSVDDIPSAIKYGVIQLAMYLYEHRGACDSQEALKNSGAHSTLAPFRLVSVLL